MKAFKYLMMAAVMALPVFMTSCDDDDDDKSVSVDEKLVKEGISPEITGGFYKIKVTGDSKWQASLSEDCLWATLLSEEGKGDAIINLYVESNFTGVARNANVIIESGKNTFSIPVRQLSTDINSSDYLDLSTTKGLGYGWDPINDEIKAAQLLQTRVAAELANTDKIRYGTLYSETKNQTAVLENENVDSLENKSDTLGVSLSLSIAYNLFKFGLKGAYYSTEKRITNAKTYRYSANFNLQESMVSPRTAAETYQSWLNDEKPKDDYRQIILAPTFTNYMAMLEKAFKSTNPNQRTINRIFSSIISDYGLGVIYKTKLGGNICLSSTVDTVKTNEAMGLKDAEVTVAVKSGLFSLDAKVAATYQKSMEEILDNANNSLLVSGNVKSATTIYSKLASGDYATLNAEIRKWADGLKVGSSETSNTEIIEKSMVPIWTLMHDFEIQMAFIDYIESNKTYSENVFVKEWLKAFDEP